MDHLQSVFVAEAEELIASLENALLDFETDLGNKASIEEIFRIMHSLKGSAGMFGYENLAHLTHDLETIYDLIRENKLDATVSILDVTLRTVDHIKSLLADRQLRDPKNQQVHRALLQNIKELYERETLSAREAGNATKTTVSTFYILFKPASGIFRTGNNPLYLVDDLFHLGEGVTIHHAAPELFTSSYQPDQCYMFFEVILAGSITEEQIREVFLFVEDNAQITIVKLADENLLHQKEFVEAITRDDALMKPEYGAEIVRAMADTVKRKVVTGNNGQQSFRNEQATSIRVSSDKLDELMNLVSELVTSQARLSLLAGKTDAGDFLAISENIEKITRRLRDNAFSICLVPLESVVTRFHRLVRDLSKDLDKEVVFVTEGTETEIDRSLIEKITDPILHILRNCIDHGIEPPEERMQKQKDRRGAIRFNAYHSGTYVHIEISDDGRGIDLQKVRAKAIAKGLIRSEVALDEKEVLRLIFSPGFSTAEKVTDVSGRGVGMDIVRRNIEAIQGEVTVHSKPDEGTTFIIRLPLTLSIMDGMLVKIASSDYILPLSAVDKCYEIETKLLKGEASQKIVLDGNLVPVFNLREVFNEGPSGSPITQVVKINYDNAPIGITVDSVVGEYQAVMKPLGELYKGQDEFSGATILGDGSVALVVDTYKFIRQLILKSDSHN